MSEFQDPDDLNLNKVHPIRDTTSTTAAQDIDDNFDHVARALQTIKEMLDELQVAVLALETLEGEDETPSTVQHIITHIEEVSRDPWPLFNPSSGSGSGELDADDVMGVGYWTPLTDGDETATEFIFASGECIMVWVATP